MWAIATLAGLVGLVILVLCVPLDMAFWVDVYGKPKLRLRLRLVWLFGLVSKELSREKKKAEEKKVLKEKPKKKRRVGFGAILEILKVRGLAGQFKSLLRGVIRSFRISQLEANFRVGLDNPADTGLLLAVIGPVTHILNRSFPHQIRVQPSFTEAVLEGFSSGNLSLRPIQLVPPLVRFIFSLATIRVLKILALTKWKRKR